MYAGTGISTDSARRKKSKAWARWTAKQCKKLFQATPMPDLAGPTWDVVLPGLGQAAFASDGSDAAGPFVVIPRN